jgi:hypothetical protein
VESAHVAQVEDDPAVDGAVTRDAVAATADRELEVVVAGEQDGMGDVAGVRGADDGKRRGVDCRLVDLAAGLVVDVTGENEASIEAAGEGVEIGRVDVGARGVDRFHGVWVLD